MTNDPTEAGFYVLQTYEDYTDYERIRPGIDRVERITRDHGAKYWYSSARAVDLGGDDVCPEWEGGRRQTWRECLADLDKLPAEYGYHNHDSTPGATKQ